jgi:hypothetical protein
MVAMSATVPSTGAEYLQENNSDSQVLHWPLIGEPSGVLGLSLDGFPIYVS